VADMVQAMADVVVANMVVADIVVIPPTGIVSRCNRQPDRETDRQTEIQTVSQCALDRSSFAPHPPQPILRSASRLLCFVRLANPKTKAAHHSMLAD